MARQEFTLDLSGQSEEDVRDLKDWLEHADIPGLSVTETSAQREGTMGPEWIPVLTALLSAPAAVVLANAVRDWVKYRRKKLKVTIKEPDGSTVIIDSENL